MKMNHRDALSILDISGQSSFDDIKVAYRRACAMYHPDRNPAGLEMMKLVNAAYQALSDYVSGSVDTDDENWADQNNLGDDLNAALNAIQGLGLTIEICGSWLWVSGDTKPHKEILKLAGFKWASKKLMWSFCGGERTSSRGKFSMDDIRLKHGSVAVKSSRFERICA